MPRIFSILVLVPFLGLVSSVHEPPKPVSQDAYVWQRVWTPALRSSLARSADLVSAWRVLVAETESGGTLKSVAVDWAALAATKRPVVAVVRIDGFLANLDQAALLARIKSLAATWKSAAGIEIDYDCATSKLADYAGFLARVRALTGIPRRFSITTLPTWLSSSDLAPVLAEVDEAVLQVHAVSVPQEGLFDADLARRWIDTFAARTGKPFRVALPDYGARVVEAEDGRILAIESETPRLVGGASTLELMAAPAEVARLLANLESSPPEHFAGVVWFRLPTEDDALTWSLATWRAVAKGESLTTHIAAVARPGSVPGMSDVVLVNGEDIDAFAPREVVLPSSCDPADGVNGYARDARGGEIVLRRLQTALLRGHHARTIGWARCIPVRGNFDVRP